MTKRCFQRLLSAVLISAVMYSALAATAFARPAPILGLSGAVTQDGTGFGVVRPSEINYGGDPTSYATKINWSSWGGRRAIGHGIANWVWPGFSIVPGATPVRAEIVAYDLGTCEGAPAYQHVAWFWPSRGQTFRPYRFATNLCTGKLPSGPIPREKTNRCGREQIGRPVAEARDIKAEGGAGCGTARRFLATHRLMGTLTTTTKAHIGRWWCGAESNGNTPALYACSRGNTNAFYAFLYPRE